MDIKKLKLELSKNLGDLIIDDLKDKKMILRLSDLLLKEAIIIKDGVHSWEEALKICGDNLKSRGHIKDSYTENLIASLKEEVPYIVGSNKLALPHCKNENNVYSTSFSLLILKEPIFFSKDLSSDIILAFASIDGCEHLDALIEFMDLSKKYKFSDFLRESNNRRKILEKIKKYEFLKGLGNSSN